MKQHLSDFGVDLGTVPIMCDNTSAINITKNPVMHSRTKHIEIRHHFIRDQYQNGNIMLDYVNTSDQLADIFTKALPKESFFYIRMKLGIMDQKEI